MTTFWDLYKRNFFAYGYGNRFIDTEAIKHRPFGNEIRGRDLICFRRSFISMKFV